MPKNTLPFDLEFELGQLVHEVSTFTNKLDDMIVSNNVPQDHPWRDIYLSVANAHLYLARANYHNAKNKGVQKEPLEVDIDPNIKLPIEVE